MDQSKSPLSLIENLISRSTPSSHMGVAKQRHKFDKLDLKVKLKLSPTKIVVIVPNWFGSWIASHILEETWRCERKVWDLKWEHFWRKWYIFIENQDNLIGICAPYMEFHRIKRGKGFLFWDKGSESIVFGWKGQEGSFLLQSLAIIWRRKSILRGKCEKIAKKKEIS